MMSLDKESKLEMIKIKWAETIEVCKNLTDDELILRITELERIHVEAQTALEAARQVGNTRKDNARSKFAEMQREQDRKYSPKPVDKVAFDKKARQEKVAVDKNEKAIESMVKTLGLTPEAARQILINAKRIKPGE